MRSTRQVTLFLCVLLLGGLLAPAAFAHCQIPCGIYGDPLRFDEMREHVETIEKSMKQIEEIGASDTPNHNQLVRWVNNKEDHAEKLTETVTYYFMAQRIKIPAHDDDVAQKKYTKEITLLHHIMVHAMKAKQTTDLEHVEKLRQLIHDFEHSYMGEEPGG